MEKEVVQKKSTCSMRRGQPPESMMNLSGFMVYKLSQYVQEEFETFFEPQAPLKARHFVVLRALVNEGSMSQQQLCEALWIDRASMVGVVQQLIDLELVKKREHPEDKRSFMISMTAKGDKFYQKHSDDFEKLDKKIFSGLNDTDLKQLRSLLRKAMAQTGDK